MPYKSKTMRRLALLIAPAVCGISLVSLTAVAQQPRFATNHLQPVMLDSAVQSGWKVIPSDQRPKLRFDGTDVQITTRDESMVMLSREIDSADPAAEVWLTRSPASTSSISGLGLLGDSRHAVIIGLEAGRVVLWQLDPTATRILASQPVNSTSPLQFRVSGGSAASARFYWRHKDDKDWHGLGLPAANTALANWKGPMRFGLLLDGPRGSAVTFTGYHAAAAGRDEAQMMAAQ